MDKGEFWKTVEATKGDDDDRQHAKRLISSLRRLSAEDILLQRATTRTLGGTNMTASAMQPLSKVLVFLSCLLSSFQAHADWYYYVMKVVCTNDELRILDYSAYNEAGEARAAEPGAIDVDTLSTWRRTPDDLNVPDKPRPHVTICNIPAGKYRVVLTNAGGGYSAPYPVVNVREISDPKQPKVLFRNLALAKSHEYKRYEIVFSSKYPKGQIVEEK